MSGNGVTITGLGVVSSLGCSVGELTRRFARAECAAPAGGGVPLSELPEHAVPQGVRLGRLDRLCRFFLAASCLALEDASLSLEALRSERAGLSFGTGLGCLLTNVEYGQRLVEHGPPAASPQLFAYTVSSAAAGEVSIALGIKGPNLTCHMGLAAGIGAVGYGHDLIRMGKADVVLAGGADVIGEPILAALNEMGLLKALDRAGPFDQQAPGVCPGEAAVVVVLEREGAFHHGRQCRGVIEGWAAGFEPSLTHRARVPKGVSATLDRALRSSGRLATDVGLVVSSAHGTEIDRILCEAMGAVLGKGSETLVVAPKATVGETFGAAGALGLALASGLLQGVPEMAAGVGFDVGGAALATEEATRRLRSTAVAMIESTCYSGNVASIVLARGR